MLNLRRRRRRPALTIPQFGSGVMGRVDASQRDRVMWSISSEDIERAKERLRRRRGEIEARYAEELQALDTELKAIAALERVAVDFASKNGREDLSPEVDPDPPIPAAAIPRAWRRRTVARAARDPVRAGGCTSAAEPRRRRQGRRLGRLSSPALNAGQGSQRADAAGRASVCCPNRSGGAPRRLPGAAHPAKLLLSDCPICR